MNPTDKSSLPKPPAVAQAPESGGVKSRWGLDFQRSPYVIFAFSVGILVLYYAGWGLLKLIQLLKG